MLGIVDSQGFGSELGTSALRSGRGGVDAVACPAADNGVFLFFYNGVGGSYVSQLSWKRDEFGGLEWLWILVNFTVLCLGGCCDLPEPFLFQLTVDSSRSCC